MREIKFEVWDCYNKEMHENLTIASPFWTDGSYQEVYCKIRQYIGLKDINWKEIYEGDIVYFDNTDIGGVEGRAEVVQTTDLTLVDSPSFGLWFINRGFYPNMLGEIEVIGNIYENPELLEE